MKVDILWKTTVCLKKWFHPLAVLNSKNVTLSKEAFTDLRVWTLKHWFFNKSSNIFNIFYHPKEMVNVHDVCMYTFLHTYIVCANNTMFWTTLSLCSLLCCTVLRWYGISKSPWISSEPGISLAILTISMGWLLV